MSTESLNKRLNAFIDEVSSLYGKVPTYIDREYDRKLQIEEQIEREKRLTGDIYTIILRKDKAVEFRLEFTERYLEDLCKNAKTTQSILDHIENDIQKKTGIKMDWFWINDENKKIVDIINKFIRKYEIEL